MVVRSAPGVQVYDAKHPDQLRFERLTARQRAQALASLLVEAANQNVSAAEHPLPVVIMGDYNRHHVLCPLSHTLEQLVNPEQRCSVLLAYSEGNAAGRDAAARFTRDILTRQVAAMKEKENAIFRPGA
ncbi:hypothetical protein WJX72_007355 [[Myrmecia] bisecta]|uniref:Endonuclease/exonuclease/phosphatase domain-containing protein n=1 Tax=[Myrmecia] bisecta TaxID=41462 RepID=A0AAW1R7Z4_9CHLO